MPRCCIEGISHDGQGVARIEGLAVFVPGALPGEIADVKVVQTKKNFARGHLEKIIEAVPERTIPPCRYYDRCGGCAYQHAAYQLQLDLKTSVVAQNLRRIGGVQSPVAPCMASPQQWRYRNKVTWHAASDQHGWKMGYYLADGHEVLPINDCLLISQPMQELSNRVAAALDDIRMGDHRIEVVVRQSSLTGDLTLLIAGLNQEHTRWLANQVGDLAVTVAAAKGNKVEAVKGTGIMEDAIGEIQYRFNPLAFFQVNPGQTLQMVNIIKKQLPLQGDEEILDSYCGVGTLALQLAPLARRVMGIEFFEPAVQDAKRNARLNGFRNCRFLGGAAESVLPTLTNRFDAVILDPPRSGCHPKVIQEVSRLKIPRVVYVSCEPSTLARDLKRFQETGYQIRTVQPVDMFPWTRHVETVVLMSRAGK